MDIQWIFAENGRFSDFCNVLNKFNNDEIYNTSFVQILANTYWQEYKLSIYFKFVLTNIAYVALILIYFCVYMDSSFSTEKFVQIEDPVKLAVSLLIIVFWLYHVWAEYKQFTRQGSEYIKSFFNVVDVIQYPLTFIILITHEFGVFDIQLKTLRILATYDVLALWVKLMDTLRVFD